MGRVQTPSVYVRPDPLPASPRLFTFTHIFLHQRKLACVALTRIVPKILFASGQCRARRVNQDLWVRVSQPLQDKLGEGTGRDLTNLHY
jgi:hypothetical protein